MLASLPGGNFTTTAIYSLWAHLKGCRNLFFLSLEVLLCRELGIFWCFRWWLLPLLQWELCFCLFHKCVWTIFQSHQGDIFWHLCMGFLLFLILLAGIFMICLRDWGSLSRDELFLGLLFLFCQKHVGRPIRSVLKWCHKV